MHGDGCLVVVRRRGDHSYKRMGWASSDIRRRIIDSNDQIRRGFHQIERAKGTLLGAVSLCGRRILRYGVLGAGSKCGTDSVVE